MATRSDNLPAYLPSLIGREGAVAERSARLHESERGVLTLTGAGGSGKTRLALAIALTVRDSQEFEDGVWLVELASVRDPVLVPGAVAAALGIKEHPGKPVRDTLLEQLQPRALLLLFDNCEHVVEACAALVEDVVRNAPRLRILTTSREPLRVPGERVWLVPPLPIPDLQVATEADKLAQNPAVQLFVERAQAVQPSMVLNERTGPPVAAICARLDGLPLALELAAARTTVLTPEQILLRLDDAFRLLIGGSRTAPSAPADVARRAGLELPLVELH